MSYGPAVRRLIVGTLIFASCASSAPRQMHQREIAEISSRSAAVSAKLVEDPTAPGVQLGPGEEYTRPQLMPGNPKPEYPPELVAKNLPLHVVSVRVTFAEDGRAVDISSSPLAESTEDEYTPRFLAEVRKAVAGWTCWPAQIRKFRPGDDLDGDGKPDYRIVAGQKILKTYFDMSFSFEVVNGQPVVKHSR